MTKILFLVILFQIDGQPSLMGGFLPLPQINEEVCQERMMFLYNYLSSTPGFPPIYNIGCVEADDLWEAVTKVKNQ